MLFFPFALKSFPKTLYHTPTARPPRSPPPLVSFLLLEQKQKNIFYYYLNCYDNSVYLRFLLHNWKICFRKSHFDLSRERKAERPDLRVGGHGQGAAGRPSHLLLRGASSGGWATTTLGGGRGHREVGGPRRDPASFRILRDQETGIKGTE